MLIYGTKAQKYLEQQMDYHGTEVKRGKKKIGTYKRQHSGRKTCIPACTMKNRRISEYTKKSTTRIYLVRTISVRIIRSE